MAKSFVIFFLVLFLSDSGLTTELDCKFVENVTNRTYDISAHALENIKIDGGRTDNTMKALDCTCKNEEDDESTV